MRMSLIEVSSVNYNSYIAYHNPYNPCLARKHEILKITEQLLDSITYGDYDTYTYTSF